MESSTGRVFEGPAAIPTAGNLAAQDQKIASAEAGGAATSISREQEEQMGALRAQGQMLGARKVELWPCLAHCTCMHMKVLLICHGVYDSN